MLIHRIALQGSLDNINPELNENYSKLFFEYFSNELGIQDDRGYMYATTPFSEWRTKSTLTDHPIIHNVASSKILGGHIWGTWLPFGHFKNFRQ